MNLSDLLFNLLFFCTGMFFLIVGLLIDMPFVAISGVMLWLIVMARLIISQRVVVPEHTLFVVGNVYRKEFSRILGHGIYYLSPIEQVNDEIDLVPVPVTGIVEKIRTNDGMPFNISFEAMIVAAPTDLTGDLRSIMAKVLPDYLEPMAKGRIEESLRELIGRYSAKELNDGRFLPVLNHEFDQKFKQKIENIGVTVYRSVINQVTPPSDYDQSVTHQHVRENEARAQAIVIELLRDSLRGVPNADKHLIAELEKLRTVAGGKGSVIYAPRASQPIESDHIEEPPLPWEAIFRPRDDEDSHISA